MRNRILGLVLLLSPSIQGFADDPPPIPLDRIVRTLEARDKGLMSFELHATIIGVDENDQPKPNWAPREFFYAETADGKREHREIYTTTDGRKSVHWNRDDGKFRYWISCPPLSSDVVSSVSITKSESTPSRNSMGMNEILSLLGPRGVKFSILAATGTDLKTRRDPSGDTIVAMTVRDGTVPIGAEFSESHGFMTREVYSGTTANIVVTKFQNVDGFWFPAEGYGNGLDIRGDAYRTRFVVDRIRVNFEPPADRFGMPELTRGSIVTNQTDEGPKSGVFGVEPGKEGDKDAALKEFVAKYGDANEARKKQILRPADDARPVTGVARAFVDPPSVTIVSSKDRPKERTTLRIRNVGDKPFALRRVWGNSADVISYEPKTVPPGGESVVVVEIMPAEVTSGRAIVHIRTDIPDQPMFEFYAMVKGPAPLPYLIHVDPPIAFGNVSRVGSQVKFRAFANEQLGSEPWLKTMGSTIDGITVSGKLRNERKLDDGATISRSYDCVAKIEKQLPPGEHFGHLTLPIPAGGSNRQPRYPVSVSVLRSVEARPGALYGDFSKFEDVPVYTITFRNISKPEGLKIEPLNPDAERFAIEKIGDANDAVTYRVRVIEPFGKELDTELAFRTNAAEMPEIKMPVRLKVRE